MFCLLLVASAILEDGCATGTYPDQREAFMKSNQGKGYTIFETSGRELEDQVRWTFDFAYIQLNTAKKNVASDTNACANIDRQLASLQRSEEILAGEAREFTRGLRTHDRVFRYTTESSKPFERGILVVNDGQIVVQNRAN